MLQPIPFSYVLFGAGIPASQTQTHFLLLKTPFSLYIYRQTESGDNCINHFNAISLVTLTVTIDLYRTFILENGLFYYTAVVFWEIIPERQTCKWQSMIVRIVGELLEVTDRISQNCADLRKRTLRSIAG